MKLADVMFQCKSVRKVHFRLKQCQEVHLDGVARRDQLHFKPLRKHRGLKYPPPFQFTGVTCATSNHVVDPFDVCLSSEAPSASPYLHFCIILAVTASLLSQRCYIFRGLKRQPIFYTPLWSCCSPLQAPAPL